MCWLSQYTPLSNGAYYVKHLYSVERYTLLCKATPSKFTDDCVERVDGVVLDSSSVSEGREKEDIFLYFIKQRLTNNELIFNSQDVGIILRPNKVIKFPKRLIPIPE